MIHTYLSYTNIRQENDKLFVIKISPLYTNSSLKLITILIGRMMTKNSLYKNFYLQYDPEVMLQEGIDVEKEHRDWVEDTKYKLQNMEILGGKNPTIPHITHSIYFSNKQSPHTIKDVGVKKSIRSTNRLNDAALDFEHYFWTNTPEIIPDEMKAIKNLKIRSIDEFKDHSLWSFLNRSIEEAQLEPGFFAQVSDILRIMAVDKYGGIYHDLDCEIYDAPELVKAMDKFSFINSRELNIDNSFIGNAFIAASPKHPVLTKAVELCERNFNPDQHLEVPEYIKRPFNKIQKIFFEAGPVMFTVAYYKARKYSQQSGNLDVIFPPEVLYNVEYARATTEGYISSSFYRSTNSIDLSRLDHQFHGIPIRTWAGDMFTGNWGGDLSAPIDYDQHTQYLTRQQQIILPSISPLSAPKALIGDRLSLLPALDGVRANHSSSIISDMVQNTSSQIALANVAGHMISNAAKSFYSFFNNESIAGSAPISHEAKDMDKKLLSLGKQFRALYNKRAMEYTKSPSESLLEEINHLKDLQDKAMLSLERLGNFNKLAKDGNKEDLQRKANKIWKSYKKLEEAKKFINVKSIAAVRESIDGLKGVVVEQSERLSTATPVNADKIQRSIS